MNKEQLVEAGRKGGSAPKHRWTEEEKEIVRRDYKGTHDSAQEIADRLGVTFFAVRGQISKMGISFHPDRQKWTPEQDDQVCELIHRYSPQGVARRMHRSINSVVVRAKRLRQYRRDRDGWYTKKDVCEIFGVDHKWLQRRIDSGALVATPHNGSRPKQNGGACWHITEEALRRFIKRYPQELQGRNVDMIQVVEILVGLDVIVN